MDQVWVLRHLVLAIAFVVVSGCMQTGRLYNLDTAEVIHLEFPVGFGHGRITGRLPNGAPLEGEYSTVSNRTTSFSTARATVSGPGGFAWASAQGFSMDEPNKQYGSATLIGGGLVIEIVYAVSAGSFHGYGVGRDNKGGRYRVQF